MAAIKALWFVSGLAGLFVVYALIGASSPEAQHRIQARAAIEQCWQQQGRKSVDAAGQQFVAVTREQMEAAFRARFNATP